MYLCICRTETAKITRLELAVRFRAIRDWKGEKKWYRRLHASEKRLVQNKI